MSTEKQKISGKRYALYVHAKGAFLFCNKRELDALLKEYTPAEFLHIVFKYHCVKWAQMDMDDSKEQDSEKKNLFKKVERCFEYISKELNQEGISNKSIQKIYQPIVKESFNERAKEKTKIKQINRVDRQLNDHLAPRYIAYKDKPR